MTERYLFDSWAILAYLQGEEPAAGRVSLRLEDAYQKRVEICISIINLGEVYYRIGKVLGAQRAEDVLNDLGSLPIQIIPADNELVLRAARWKMRHPISYADAFAIATAEKLNATLVTGDPELLALKDIISLEALERE